MVKQTVSFLCLLLVSGCGKKPKPDFTWSPENPKAGTEVQFTNLSEHAKSYSWNFGDASIGKEKDPVHVYQDPGDYIIDLDAHKGVSTTEKTYTITVVP